MNGSIPITILDLWDKLTLIKYPIFPIRGIHPVVSMELDACGIDPIYRIGIGQDRSLQATCEISHRNFLFHLQLPNRRLYHASFIWEPVKRAFHPLLDFFHTLS